MSLPQDEDDCDDYEDVPCLPGARHAWVTSDEDDNVCYCELCGIPEY